MFAPAPLSDDAKDELRAAVIAVIVAATPAVAAWLLEQIRGGKPAKEV